MSLCSFRRDIIAATSASEDGAAPARLPPAGEDDAHDPPGVVAARWACGLAGAAAAVATKLPWASASLADRGADLLVESRAGLDYGATGYAALVCGLAAVTVCLLTSWWPRLRALAAGLPVVGATLAALAVTRLDAAEPLARKLSTLRIGTFQTDQPVVSSAVGAGLWLCLGSGVLLLVGGLGWLAMAYRDRRAAGRAAGAASPGLGPAGFDMAP